MVDAIVNNPVHQLGAQCEFDSEYNGMYSSKADELTAMAVKLQNMFELGMIEFNNQNYRMELTTYGQEYFIKKYAYAKQPKTSNIIDPQIGKAFFGNKTCESQSKRFEINNSILSSPIHVQQHNEKYKSSPIHIEEIVDQDFCARDRENVKLIPRVGKKNPDVPDYEG